jgi:hypothetical protein
MTTAGQDAGIAIRPFRIDVSEDALADVRRRLASTRWPSPELVDDRSQGDQLATTQALVHWWPPRRLGRARAVRHRTPGGLRRHACTPDPRTASLTPAPQNREAVDVERTPS